MAIVLGLLALALSAIVMVRWARRRSRGAVVAGALFSVMAPDPTLEARAGLRDEAAHPTREEEGEGEPEQPGVK